MASSEFRRGNQDPVRPGAGLQSPGGEAFVTSGRLVIPYRRAGEGRPVVLLDHPVAGRSGDEHLLRALSGHFRVIRPDPPRLRGGPAPGGVVPGPHSTPDWLRGVIDGLGLGRCNLVASGEHALPAAWFAIGDRHRIARLVLLVGEPADPLAPGDHLDEALARSGLEILLVRRPVGDPALPPSAGSTEAMIRFLAGGLRPGAEGRPRR